MCVYIEDKINLCISVKIVNKHCNYLNNHVLLRTLHGILETKKIIQANITPYITFIGNVLSKGQQTTPRISRVISSSTVSVLKDIFLSLGQSLQSSDKDTNYNRSVAHPGAKTCWRMPLVLVRSRPRSSLARAGSLHLSPVN